MTFTYRSVKGSLLTAAEVDANFLEVETLHDATEGYKNAAAASASDASASELAAADSETVALAAANYDGAWTAKIYAVPASVSHLGALWVLEEAAAATDIPGTSTKWTFWSLTEYPIEVNPTLDLDFENQKYKSYEDHSGLVEWSLNGVDSKLTFTRATTKTYFDAKGIMQTASAGEIAIDYDPDTGECLGFQPEAAATNLLTYSEDFSNAAWHKAGIGVTVDNHIAPDGKLTADRLLEDTSTGVHQVAVLDVPFVSGTTYTVSKYFKAIGNRKVRLGLGSAAFSSAPLVIFDLTSGTGVIDSGSPDFTIRHVGDGWYRCSMTATATATTTANVTCVLIQGDSTTSYTGDGTSGLYIWGAQLEAV